PAPDGLVERGEEGGLVQARGPADEVQLELGARRRRELEQVARAGRQPREAFAHDLADALGGPELRRRPGEPDGAAGDLNGAGLDERAPELADQERVAPGEVADRLGDPLDVVGEVA